MKIQTVELRSYRTHDSLATLSFDPGLTVLTGANEEGKSTVFDAVRDVLTVKARATGEQRKHMLARSGSVPHVKLTFEHDGASYELEKVFAETRGTCTLVERRPGQLPKSLTADAAEARLRELAGLGEARRGPAPSVFGVIWPEQGRTHLQPVDGVDAEQVNAIGQRLAQVLGAGLLGTAGERILARAEEEFALYFTATGQEKRSASAPLAAAVTALTGAQGALDAVQASSRQHEASLADHERLRAKEVQDRNALGALKAEVASAEKLAAEIDELRRRRDAMAPEVRRLEAEVKAAGQVVADRVTHRKDVEAAEKNARELTVRADEVRARAEELGAAVPGFEPARADAQARYDGATAAHSKLRLHRDALGLERSAAELADAVARANEADAAARAASARVCELPVDAKTATELDRLDRETSVAKAGLDAITPVVKLVAERAIAVEVNGEVVGPLGTGELLERSVTDRLSLRIPGVARVSVSAGAGDVAKARERVDHAERNLAARLAATGVATVDAARACAAERGDVERGLAEARARLKILAPNGLDALARRAEEASAAATAARAGAGDRSGLPVDSAALEQQLREAGATEALRRAELGTLEQAFREHEGKLRQAEVQLAGLAEAATSAGARVGELHGRLAQHVAAHGEDAALHSNLAQVDAGFQRGKALLDALRARLAPLEATLPPGRLEALRQQHATLQAGLARSRDELVRLEVVLQHTEAEGLHEQLAATEAARDRARSEVGRLEARARAAKLLRNMLVTVRDEALRQFVPPLRAALEPLIGFVFSGATVAIDEQLRVVAIERGAERDAFDELSPGAREQVALAVRLAIAKVLAAGKGLPVLLDDPLVHADPERFAAACTLLKSVVPDLQVVVASCHPNWAEELGSSAAVVMLGSGPQGQPAVA